MASMAVTISPLSPPPFKLISKMPSISLPTISHFPKSLIHIPKIPLKLSRHYSSPPSHPHQLSTEPGSESDSEPVSKPGRFPPVLKKRKRYRKECPGENKGITEEMRFVAMKLRNNKTRSNLNSTGLGLEAGPSDEGGSDGGEGAGSWEPTMEGFLKYLVDSKLVFETLEKVVEDSDDVSYAYFRKTGLERAENLAMDLEWFGQQGLQIPEPSSPGVSYATYLKELAENSAPLFLSHFYNVYFSHIAGGQVIARQVADKLLQGRELELCKWERDAEELLKEVRVTLNMLSEHWSRDDKNKCLKEAAKSFRHLGQIVRLIIL